MIGYHSFICFLLAIQCGKLIDFLLSVEWQPIYRLFDRNQLSWCCHWSPISCHLATKASHHPANGRHWAEPTGHHTGQLRSDWPCRHSRRPEHHSRRAPLQISRRHLCWKACSKHQRNGLYRVSQGQQRYIDHRIVRHQINWHIFQGQLIHLQRLKHLVEPCSLDQRSWPTWTSPQPWACWCHFRCLLVRHFCSVSCPRGLFLVSACITV